MHLTRNRMRAATTAALSAASLVVAVAPGATAAEPTPRAACDEVPNGYECYEAEARNHGGGPNCDSPKSKVPDLGGACYKREGDIFFVRDAEADGHRVTVFWTVFGHAEPKGFCHDLLGEAAGWAACNLPNDVIPEDDTLWFEVQIREGNDILVHGNTVDSRT